MRKYLHADGNYSTAQWYDAATNGNAVAAPADGDWADLNGYALAMDVAVIPASGGTLIELSSPAKAGRLNVDLNAVGNRTINAISVKAGVNPTAFIFCSNATYTLTINANQVIGGASSGNVCIYNMSTATININTNWIFGGSGLSAGHGVTNAAGGIINVFGAAVVGGTGANYGVYNQNIGTINITGTIRGSEYDKGGIGVYNNGTGRVNLTGNMIYKTAAPYWGSNLYVTAGSQYYIQIQDVKFPQQLKNTQVLKGINHGGDIGMLAPASPFRRSKNRFV